MIYATKLPQNAWGLGRRNKGHCRERWVHGNCCHNNCRVSPPMLHPFMSVSRSPFSGGCETLCRRTSRWRRRRLFRRQL